MEMEVPILAGATSTVIFAVSTLPMLYKACKSRDLGSYSLGNILLSNIGNLIHSVYIFSLPVGPIWLLHSFYLVSTALMLIWYLQYELDQDQLLDAIQGYRQIGVEWLRVRVRVSFAWTRTAAAAKGGQLFFVPSDASGRLKK